MYRRHNGRPEVLLVHPGGPLWARKDAGVWSIPKGEIEPGEDELSAAKREFEEELGIRPDGEYLSLGSVTQKSGKAVHAWAFQGDCDPASAKCNTFAMEWPPHSGKKQEFPEIDRAEFFSLEEARMKINPAQIPLIDALERVVVSGHESHR